MNICILMSTYNGEKFIREQIESITIQAVDASISFLIRDDGSTDNTACIITEAVKGYNCRLYKGKNTGPSSSFLKLIALAPEADLYAFSDQDDIWFPNKLSTAAKCIGDTSLPTLWVSDYDVTDQNLHVIKKSALRSPDKEIFRNLFYNRFPGNTFVFNKALMYELKKLNMTSFRMHDILTICTALCIGKVYYNSDAYVAYRQHEKNAIGYYHKKSNPFKWIIDKIHIVLYEPPFNYSVYSQRMLELYSEILDDKTKSEFRLIADYKHGLNRYKLLKKNYTRGNGDRTSISIRARILLGRI